MKFLNSPSPSLGEALTRRTLTLILTLFTLVLAQSTLAARFAGDQYHSAAVLEDGKVLTWGKNTYGQLGDGTTDDRPAAGFVVDSSGTPVEGIKSVAVGEGYTVALKSDGSVISWGINTFKQLGDGSTDQRNHPVPVVDAGGIPLSGIIAIASTKYRTLALKSDGTLLLWGSNSAPAPVHYTDNSGSPTTPYPQYEDGSAVSDIKEIAAGSANVGGGHFLALKTDGVLLGWGNDSFGQIGRPNYPYSGLGPYPVMLEVGAFQYEPLSSVKTMAAGAAHSLALLEDNSLLAWGYNDQGQLGDGTRDNRDYPVAVKDQLDDPVTVDAQALTAGLTYSIAHLVDGTLLSWGWQQTSPSGDPNNTLYPQLEKDPTGTAISAVEVVAAYEHNFALQESGNLVAWGRNSSGQLGIGTDIWRINTPVKVVMALDPNEPLNDVRAISAGRYESLAAIADEGLLVAWGGDFITDIFPHRIRDDNGAPVSGIKAIAKGDNHSLALTKNGTVLAWGKNNYGQLGIGPASSSTTLNPTPVIDGGGTPISGIIAIGVGGSHSLALTSNGTMLAWGYNGVGQLGNGAADANPHPVPAPVVDSSASTITGITAIAVGGVHNLARKSDGTVIAWGGNDKGQIGDGTWHNNRPNPVSVIYETTNPISGIDQITAFGAWSYALGSTGQVLGWGQSNGQLGAGVGGGIVEHPLPIVDELSQPISSVATLGNKMAIKSDASLLQWGDVWTATGYTSYDYAVPVAADTSGTLLMDVTEVSKGLTTFALALNADRTVSAWGHNSYFQTGHPSADNAAHVYPVPVMGKMGDVTLFFTGPGTLQFTSNSFNVAEEAGQIEILVSRTSGSEGAASVNYTTVDETAQAGNDYTSVSGMLQWADGEASVKIITIPISADNALEGDETFRVELTGAVGAPLGDVVSSVVTIVDDKDRDDDGVDDIDDAFPDDPAASVDTDGDGSPDYWNDGKDQADSITGLHLDRFPQDAAASVDDDLDGHPDAWNPGKSQQDSTYGLTLDLFPNDSSEWADLDGDGVGDNGDNCPSKANPGQLNTDGDAAGNACDNDDDNDGLTDSEETQIHKTNPLIADTDGDGYLDGDEVEAETDPLDPTDVPITSGLNIVIIKAAIDKKK